jgi:putative membrane protein
VAAGRQVAAIRVVAAALAAADRREAGRDMSFISRKDRTRIARAITAAEKNTSGEIVAVVAASSDDYMFLPIMWAALLALAVPLICLTFTDWPSTQIYALQLAVFAGAALAVQWWPLRIALIPRSVKRARAHRHAMEQFLAQNLHTTKGRTGVLIFVSAAEHFAEVIADEGIYKKVPQETWDDMVAGLTADIARGKGAEGFVAAIKQSGEVLSEHFPPGKSDKNELSNHLIVLE